MRRLLSKMLAPSPGITVLNALLLALIFDQNLGCELRVKVKSLTATPFQFKMAIPEKGIEAEQILLENPSQKEIMIKAEDCGDKPWKLRTFRQNPSNGEWELAKETSVKLDGKGQVEIKVHDDLHPSLGARLGVACAESFFCGG